MTQDKSNYHSVYTAKSPYQKAMRRILRSPGQIIKHVNSNMMSAILESLLANATFAEAIDYTGDGYLKKSIKAIRDFCDNGGEFDCYRPAAPVDPEQLSARYVLLIDNKHYIEYATEKLSDLTPPSPKEIKKLSYLSAWRSKDMEDGYQLTLGYNQPDKVAALEEKHFTQKLKQLPLPF